MNGWGRDGNICYYIGYVACEILDRMCYSQDRLPLSPCGVRRLETATDGTLHVKSRSKLKSYPGVNPDILVRMLQDGTVQSVFE